MLTRDRANSTIATIAEIREFLGDRLSTAMAVREQHGKDQTWAAGAPPDAVAFVRDTVEVQKIVTICSRHQTPVIAFGTGTSLAQHAADCILMGPGLVALPAAVAHSRRTMHVVRQNLGWAVAYNLVAVPLAITGLLAPWLAALGMSASSLLVTFNALRLGRIRQAGIETQPRHALNRGAALP